MTETRMTCVRFYVKKEKEKKEKKRKNAVEAGSVNFANSVSPPSIVKKVGT